MLRFIGLDKMRETLGGDDEIILVLVEAFLEGYQALLSDLENAVAKEDIKAVEIAAHTIKGAVSNFHVQTIHDLAQKIEGNSRNGDVSLAKEQTEQLVSLMVDLEQEMLQLQSSGLVA